jgi:hypothetical protein
MTMLYRLCSRFLPDGQVYDRKDALLQKDEIALQTIKSNYFVLTVLDSKASALMRLNGVVLAAALVGISAHFFQIKTWAFELTALPSLISMILCLQVVAVDWPFLGYATVSDENANFGVEISELRKVRWFREYVYRTAWYFSLLSALIFTYQLLMLCMD